MVRCRAEVATDMVQVKICGICRPEDARTAARLRADFVGVILAPNRSRSQSLETAAKIFAAAAAVPRVGVFIDPDFATVTEAIEALGLDVVQLHGRESVELMRAIRPLASVWKAIPVGAAGALVETMTDLAPEVDALLFDTAGGGSGQTFDWTQAASLRGSFPGGTRVVMAGGLTPANVAAAIQTMAPDIVDVSSGVESETCIKSAELMQQFIEAARMAASGEAES